MHGKSNCIKLSKIMCYAIGSLFSLFLICILYFGKRGRKRHLSIDLTYELVFDVIRSSAISISDATVSFWNLQCSPFGVQAKTDLCDPYSGKIQEG